jgi:hypothetical protein
MKTRMIKLSIIPINVFESNRFEACMQSTRYEIVYHKNDVVNWLQTLPLNAMTIIGMEMKIAPMMCPMHLGKLRFTKHTPTATPDIISGTV